ncbi:MAG: hypothetical protein HY290_15190 [Planctomycetia bacterium]|nr:hypothetical protein [Planctomycetia bacterium]
MTGGLRALLAGSIDYAGMFPPAGLPLNQAIDELRRHRRGPAGWMIGRFVVPAAKLAELAVSYELERDGRLTVIVAAADSGDAFLKNLDAALTGVAEFPARAAIDTLEFRWPADSMRECDAARLGNLVHTAAGEIVASRLQPITMYFELPRPESPTAGRAGHELCRAAIAALAEYNRTAGNLNCLAGFKLRCGGTDPAAVPSPGEVAAVICECLDRGVFWKATAGLHHPLRRNGDESMHGFLNLLVAAVLAGVHRLDEKQTRAIVETVDAGQFRFTADGLSWGDFATSSAQVAAAREHSLRSFGSCSIDEPWQDLRLLELT